MKQAVPEPEAGLWLLAPAARRNSLRLACGCSRQPPRIASWSIRSPIASSLLKQSHPLPSRPCLERRDQPIFVPVFNPLIPGNTQNIQVFLYPKLIILDRNYVPCSNYLARCTAPAASKTRAEKAHINNQIAIKYPLSTTHPQKRRNLVFGESYPVTSNSPGSRNIHNSTTSLWPQTCEPPKPTVYWTPAPQNPLSQSPHFQTGHPPTLEPTGQRQFPPSTL